MEKKKIKIYLRKSGEKGDLNYELITPYGEVNISKRDNKFGAWGLFLKKVFKKYYNALDEDSVRNSTFKYTELKMGEESLKKLMDTLEKEEKLDNEVRKLRDKVSGLANLVGKQLR